MAPDLNSLPPSLPVPIPLRTRANGSSNPDSGTSAGAGATLSGGGESVMRRTESPSPSPRSASLSLQAAATVNAGLQHEAGRRTSSSSIGSSLSRQRHSPQANRRRSTVLMNLQLNDPTVPSPGELAWEGDIPTAGPQPLSSSPLLAARDPHHNRAPSLGELHQELEAEQEAQVNRLLQMIRQQQIQLQQLQAAQGQIQSSVAAEDQPSPLARTTPGSIPISPSVSHVRSSFDFSQDVLRRPSRTPSRSASPSRLGSSYHGQESEPHMFSVRDEATYYQAETQSLIRENQMLRHRLRELERQLNETHPNASVTREPVQSSHLTHSTSLSEDDATATLHRAASQLNAAAELKD